MQIFYDYNISSWSNTAAAGYPSRQLQNHSSPSPLYNISRLSILSLLNLAVVLENSFVILAVVSNRRLRNSNNNLLILSLAVADLLLGIFVLPVSIFDTGDEQQISIDDRRYRGDETDRFWCAFWQLLDFWLRTASIYSLVVITIDRFLAISFPLKYKVIMNRNAIFIVSLMVWAVSILISLPLLIISRKESSSVYKFEYSNFCDRKIITDKIYAIFYATMSFYVPFLVILIFYSKIYCRIRLVRKSIMEGFLNVERTPTPKKKQTTPWAAAVAADDEASHSQWEPEGQQGAPGRSPSVAGPAPPNRRTSESPKEAKSQDTLRVHAGGYSRHVNTYNRAPVHLSRKASSDPATEIASSRKCSASEPRIRSITWTCQSAYLTVRQPRITVTKYVPSDQGPTTAKNEETIGNINGTLAAEENARLMADHCEAPAGRKISNKHVSVEKKTIRTVGLVIGCFLFCWTGYSSVLVYSSFVGPTKQTARLLTFFTWLGYSNSAINPFIYALCNRQYRKSFANLCRLVTKGKRSSAVTQLTNNNKNYVNNNNNTYYSHSFRSHGSICSALMMNHCYGNQDEKLMRSGRVMANKISMVSNNNGTDFFV